MIMGEVLLVSRFKMPIYLQYLLNRSTNVEMFRVLVSVLQVKKKSLDSCTSYGIKLTTVQVKYMPAVSSSRKLISEYSLSNN